MLSTIQHQILLDDFLGNDHRTFGATDLLSFRQKHRVPAVLADILPRLNFDIFNSLQKRFVCIFCGGAFLILFFLLQRSGIYSKMNISHRVLYRNGGVLCPAVNFCAKRKLC